MRTLVRAVPAAPHFAADDADAFWDSIGDANQDNFGYVETP